MVDNNEEKLENKRLQLPVDKLTGRLSSLQLRKMLSFTHKATQPHNCS